MTNEREAYILTQSPHITRDGPLLIFKEDSNLRKSSSSRVVIRPAELPQINNTLIFTQGEWGKFPEWAKEKGAEEFQSITFQERQAQQIVRGLFYRSFDVKFWRVGNSSLWLSLDDLLDGKYDLNMILKCMLLYYEMKPCLTQNPPILHLS